MSPSAAMSPRPRMRSSARGGLVRPGVPCRPRHFCRWTSRRGVRRPRTSSRARARLPGASVSGGAESNSRAPWRRKSGRRGHEVSLFAKLFWVKSATREDWLTEEQSKKFSTPRAYLFSVSLAIDRTF